MAAPDAKKTATLLIASLGKPKMGGPLGMGKPKAMGMGLESIDESQDVDLEAEALKSASQEALDAIKAGDVDAFAEAMKAVHSACAGSDKED